jgi:lipopolysaccharide biosynthesis regulator YciM
VLEINTLERDAARAEMAGEYGKAASLLSRAAEAAPEDARLQLELARVLVKAGRAEEALAHLARASQAGDDVASHRIAADAYAALGQQDARDREETRFRQLVERRKEERLKNRLNW